MSKSNLVDVDLEIRHETQSAYLFYDGKVEAWCPKSKVEIEKTGKEGEVVATMPKWLAIEKGFV